MLAFNEVVKYICLEIDINVIYINEIMSQGLSDDRNFRMPTIRRQYTQYQSNKGQNAATCNMNLMKMNIAFMKIEPTNINRSGIILLPLWDFLLSMKGE